MRTKILRGTALAGMHEESKDRALANVKWLILFRLVAVVMALGITLVTARGGGRLYDELYPTYFILVVVCLANLGYLLYMGRVRRPRRFAAVQLLLDLLFVTALTYVNGAGNSNITGLYFAIILAASTLVGPSSGLVVASLATILLANVTMLTFIGQQRGWDLPAVYRNGSEPVPFGNLYLSIAFLLAQGLAYHLVAILSGRLVARLTGSRIVNEEILQNINEGVLTVDADDRVVYVNREARFLLGLPDQTNPEGMKLADVLSLTRSPRALRAALSDRSVFYRQMELVNRGADRVPVSVTASCLTDERGRRRGRVWVLMDLTERKRMEEALEQARKMELVGQLSASIAHEIRNPLASIRGSAQELADAPELTEDARKLMDVVVRESDRINAIITEFLQFAGMPRAALRRCNLNDVLNDMVVLLEGRYPERRHRIELQAPEPTWCLGDAEQLRQVFLNLGLNALEAMEENGTLRITVSSRVLRPRWANETYAGPVQERVRVTFEDEGVGFDESVRAKLFEPFFTTKTRGTGLGLSVARRIVEGHHGAIEAESRPGQGSRFTVCLQGCGAESSAVVCQPA